MATWKLFGGYFQWNKSVGEQTFGVIWNSEVDVLQGFSYCGGLCKFNPIWTRAFGHYIADGCCTGVAVKRGSTVLEFPGYSDSGKWNSIQVVIPKTLCPEILQRLHGSHQGYESILQRARDAVYWPGMADEIKKVVRSCSTCGEDAPAQPREKLVSHEVPKQPWAKVGMDLFQCRGKQLDKGHSLVLAIFYISCRRPTTLRLPRGDLSSF